MRSSIYVDDAHVKDIRRKYELVWVGLCGPLDVFYLVACNEKRFRTGYQKL